ncbi:MAG: lysophospholipase [Clostridia bacterium]|nr:lysophospholipase [Clostridia bacterium]
MKTFLFQGDSITDADRQREREDGYSFGLGYPNMVVGELSLKYPGEFRFFNKGISGDRSTSVYARMYTDIVNLKPDYMSILIGVNDVWHGINGENGVAPERYEQIMTMLYEDILKELPDIKIIVLEPFVLKGTATEARWEDFDTGVKAMAKKAKALAEKFGFTFVPLQDKFDELCKIAPSDCWLADGVHPAPAGHKLIANELIKALEL